MKLKDILCEQTSNNNDDKYQQLIDKHYLDEVFTPSIVKEITQKCSSHVRLIIKHGAVDREGVALYRGTSSKINDFLITPRKGRKSLTGDNTLLNLTSHGNIPGWNDMPKRDSSLFMTNSASYAYEFSSDVVMCIVPDQTQLGLTPSGSVDFNNTESWVLDTSKGQGQLYGTAAVALLHIVVDYLQQMHPSSHAINSIDADGYDWEDILLVDKTLQQREMSLKSIVKKVSDHYHLAGPVRGIIHDMNTRSIQSAEQLVQYYLDAQRNGFVSCKPAELEKHLIDQTREVWTESPVYAFDHDLGKQFWSLCYDLRNEGLL